MSRLRRVVPPAPAAAPAQAVQGPVVVSFDDHGELLDVVGDLRRFVAGDDSEASVLRRLQDLRAGADGVPELLQAVELSPDRYADLHIVDEGDSHHFVLHDVSDLMRSVRRNQQASHELELREAQQRRDLRRQATQPHSLSMDASLREFRRGGALLDEMVQGMRAPLVLLNGHARLLEQRLKHDPAALRSLAAIQHAAVRLDAIASNGLIGLGGLAALWSVPGMVQLSQLAGLLEQTFALQAQARGVAFKVQAAARKKDDDLLVIDDIALRQLLLNLVIHALDGIDAGGLNVALAHKGDALEIEIAHSPGGFPADRFGALLTTSELLHSEPGAALQLSALGLAVSQQLLHGLHGEVQLVPCMEGGHALWLRLPTQATATDEADR